MVQFKEGISTGVSEVNLDEFIGKLAYGLVELIAKKLQEVLVWSLQWRH